MGATLVVEKVQARLFGSFHYFAKHFVTNGNATSEDFSGVADYNNNTNTKRSTSNQQIQLKINFRLMWSVELSISNLSFAVKSGLKNQRGSTR